MEYKPDTAKGANNMWQYRVWAMDKPNATLLLNENEQENES